MTLTLFLVCIVNVPPPSSHSYYSTSTLIPLVSCSQDFYANHPLSDVLNNQELQGSIREFIDRRAN
ncbi:hypothetical protein E2C01_081121 [Portunus trituberculatus]|uniref:Uncharacterized protein n=1 Tax=Portunus trituberculatus TaxID=210409 RepID=A0A5B7J084_PORTR|nr:hypothetical protein [Portunus trituberculatus]